MLQLATVSLLRRFLCMNYPALILIMLCAAMFLFLAFQIFLMFKQKCKTYKVTPVVHFNPNKQLVAIALMTLILAQPSEARLHQSTFVLMATVSQPTVSLNFLSPVVRAIARVAGRALARASVKVASSSRKLLAFGGETVPTSTTLAIRSAAPVVVKEAAKSTPFFKTPLGVVTGIVLGGVTTGGVGYGLAKATSSTPDDIAKEATENALKAMYEKYIFSQHKPVVDIKSEVSIKRNSDVNNTSVREVNVHIRRRRDINNEIMKKILAHSLNIYPNTTTNTTKTPKNEKPGTNTFPLCVILDSRTHTILVVVFIVLFLVCVILKIKKMFD